MRLRFAAVWIGCRQDDAAFLVAAVHQLEQQIRRLTLKGQKADLVDDEHSRLRQVGQALLEAAFHL